MNAKALYTSLPNNEGIAAVKRKRDNYKNKIAPTKVITTFLALILTLHNLILNSKFYLKTKGCAMGRKHIHVRVRKEIYLLKTNLSAINVMFMV